MKHVNKYLFIVLINTFCSLDDNAIAQVFGLNGQYSIANRSTQFRTILFDNNDLTLIGQLGPDSIGLLGYCVLQTDTFGEISAINVSGDPTFNDHAFIHDSEPAILTNDGNIVLVGTTLNKNNLFYSLHNKNIGLIGFKEYDSQVLFRSVHKILLWDSYYYVFGKVVTLLNDGEVFISKIDGVGNQIWEKTYGLPEWEDGTIDAVIDEDGITILSYEVIDPNPNIVNDTKWHTRIFSIDTSGEIKHLWLSQENEEQKPLNIIKFGQEYIYTIQNIIEDGSGQIHFGSQIVRRDYNFNTIWRRNFTGTFGLNSIGNIAIGQDSMLYAVGSELNIDSNSRCVYIWKINPGTGDIIWKAKGLEDTNPIFMCSIYLNGLVVLPSGDIFAAGSSCDPSSGLSQGFIIKVTKNGCIDTLCFTVNIDKISIDKTNKISVYPNPVIDMINIDINQKLGKSIFNIFDFKGKKIFSKELMENHNVISISDLSCWPAEIYLWNLQTNENKVIQSGKIVLYNLN